VSTMSEEEIRHSLKAQSVPDHLIERHLEYQRSRGRVTGYVRWADDPPSPPTTLTTTGPGAEYAAPRVRKAEPEHEEQVTLFAWAALMEAQHPELRLLFAVPNWIGTRTRHHGAYLKAEGRKPGVPDVWLPVSRRYYHGLVIEMKVKPNRPSDEQRRWLAALEAADYAVHVCYSADEAQAVILHYLDAA
jgi:hypothetical protein